jgi:hypothetical protein
MLVALFLTLLTSQQPVDVFLLGGQSNMQGVGKVAELPEEWQQPLEGVYFWNGEGFEILDPTQTKISGRAGEFGPELGFARRLRELGWKQDLYLIKFHRSGQPLHFSLSNNKWMGAEPGPGRATFYPGEADGDENVGKHYLAWRSTCRDALGALHGEGKSPKLRGMVWMQGEADAKFEQSAVNYAASLRQLRERLLEDLTADYVQVDLNASEAVASASLGTGMYAPQLPYIYGQVLPHSPPMKRFTHRDELRASMAALDWRSGHAEATAGMVMVPTEGFPLKKDTVHYNTQGQQQLGAAFADAMAAELARTPEALADDWQLHGIVVNEPGYHVWGCSPIIDDEGKVHLFAARWPVEAKFVPGWHTACEIARYVAPGPTGPFEFAEVVVRGSGEGWNKQGIHNPSIRKVGDSYVLVYIGNTGKDFPASQTIGMMIADDLAGPWRAVDGNIDNPMLAPPTDSSIWCFESGCGVNNPSLLPMPDGRFFLYFKSKGGSKGKVKMGVAIADRLAGPYTIQPEPITANDRTIEDGYAFHWRGQVCLLTTDNHGMIENGGGLLWTSADGISFRPSPMKAFHHFKRHYLNGSVPEGARHHYTNSLKFERPQLLMVDGEPRFLYVPSGTATDGSDGTNNYLLFR